MTVTKDNGGLVRVPGVEEPVAVPASDFLVVRWAGNGGQTFTVVKNANFAEGKKGVSVWRAADGSYSLHKRTLPRRPRVKPTTPSDRSKSGVGVGRQATGSKSDAAGYDDEGFSGARMEKRAGALKAANTREMYSSKHVRMKQAQR